MKLPRLHHEVRINAKSPSVVISIIPKHVPSLKCENSATNCDFLWNRFQFIYDESDQRVILVSIKRSLAVNLRLKLRWIISCMGREHGREKILIMSKLYILSSWDKVSVLLSDILSYEVLLSDSDKTLFLPTHRYEVISGPLILIDFRWKPE